MTLAETYLLARDLAVIKNHTLLDFYYNAEYRHRNEFVAANIFPVVAVNGVSMLPRLDGIGRWGRHIILSFSTCTMVFKMAHRTALFATAGVYPEGARAQDIAAVLTFGDADGRQMFLIYADPTGCGQFTVYPAGEVPAEFAYLGVDVLDSAFNPQYLVSEAAKLGHLGVPECLKKFIMSPGVLAWIDNEFASEALFLSGLNPHADAGKTLTFQNATVLVKSTRMLYSRVLECVRNDYCLTAPVPPAALYSVYDREGSECVVCGSAIRRTLIDDRATFWCPNCQPITTKDRAHA